MDRDTLVARLSDYFFFHTIDLGDGIKTPGRPLRANKRMVLETIASQDMKGKRILDIGCANGLFSFEAEKYGAADILAVDHTDEYLKSMRELLIPYLDSNVKVMQRNLLDLRSAEIGHFDVVIFPGVLYHLRYPFWSLKIIRDLIVEDGLLILETAVLDDDNSNALLWCPSPEDSPYKGRGANSCTFFNTKALCETLASLGFEVVSCRYPDKEAATRKNPGMMRRLKRTISHTIRNKPDPVPKETRAVLLCRHKPESVNSQLQNFYEGVS
jgi:SAM-dependent methyltransferase